LGNLIYRKENSAQFVGILQNINVKGVGRNTAKLNAIKFTMKYYV
jgi:hypothetical protein